MDAGNGLALENIAVEIVLSSPRGMGLNSAGKTLRPQAAMNLPFVEVGALLSEQSCLREHRKNVLAAERDIAELRSRAAVRVGRRERVFSKGQDDQCRIHIRLEAKVAMDVLGKLACAADESRRCIKTES